MIAIRTMASTVTRAIRRRSMWRRWDVTGQPRSIGWALPRSGRRHHGRR